MGGMLILIKFFFCKAVLSDFICLGNSGRFHCFLAVLNVHSAVIIILK